MDLDIRQEGASLARLNPLKLSRRVLPFCLSGMYGGRGNTEPRSAGLCSAVAVWTVWPIIWLWALLFGFLRQRENNGRVAYKRVRLEEIYIDQDFE